MSIDEVSAPHIDHQRGRREMGEFSRSSLRRLWCAECAAESIHGRHGCIHHPVQTGPLSKDDALLMRLRRMTAPMREHDLLRILEAHPSSLRSAISRDARVRIEVSRLLAAPRVMMEM
jgi:hypothetical protein